MNPQRTRCATGFTLIEVLIGLTLLGLLLSALYSGFHGIARIWERQQDRLVAIERERLAMALLRRELKQAIPLRAAKEDGFVVVFDGMPDSVRFITALPAHLGGGTLDRVTVTATDRASADRGVSESGLSFTAEPLAPSGASSEPHQSLNAVLLTGVDAVRFRYFGTADGDTEPGWHDRWIEQSRLPDLIALRLLDRAQRDRYPELTVHLVADTLPGSPAYLVASDGE